MLKKILVSLIAFTIFVNAEELNNSIEDKYAACEKAYDACLLKCEENDSGVTQCMSTCDEELSDCNKKIEEIESN
jgi:peptidoglycan hydrolase CwlO-like protein